MIGMNNLNVIVFEKAEMDMIDFKTKYKVSIQESALILADVFKGVQQLHEDFFLTHMDLKPGNILFFKVGYKLKPKLADFDSAVIIGTPMLLRNSDEYTCREQLAWYYENAGKLLVDQKEMLSNYKHDIYSMGMVSLFMMQHMCEGESMLVDEIDGERGSTRRKETLLSGRHLVRLKSKINNEAALKFLDYSLEGRLKARYISLKKYIYILLLLLLSDCYSLLLIRII